MLKDLIAIIKERGILQVSIDLNYTSAAAILNWVKLKRVPKIRHEKVRGYIAQYKKGVAE